jgi:crossover junction endodeoxyribonuclease RuvC
VPKGEVSLPRCKIEKGKGSPARILGVDPGMGSTGFGVIELGGSGSLSYQESGNIRPRSPSTPQRIQQIFRGLAQLIDTFHPQLMAVERPFFGKNVKSAMLLGQARGAAILAAAEAGVEVREYSPLEVKQAIVGYGRAGKEQIQAMVRSILQIPQDLNSHAADALAVALCLAHCLPWEVSLKRAALEGAGGSNGPFSAGKRSKFGDPP